MILRNSIVYVHELKLIFIIVEINTNFEEFLNPNLKYIQPSHHTMNHSDQS